MSLPKTLKLLGVVSFLSLLLFLNKPLPTFADTPTPIPGVSQCPTPSTPLPITDNIDMNPTPDCIYDTRAEGVYISFNKISPKIGGDFWLCRNGDPDLTACGKINKSFLHIDADGTQFLAATLCAADDKTLTDNCDPKDKNIYFRAGSAYTATFLSDAAYKKVQAKDLPGKNDDTIYSAETGFVVKHQSPNMEIKTGTIDPKTNKVDVAVTVTWPDNIPLRKGGNTGNNYQVIVGGTNVNYEDKQCVVVRGPGKEANDINTGKFTELPIGKYNIDLWEQVDETRNFILGHGMVDSNGNYLDINHRGNCETGTYDYARIVLTVSATGVTFSQQVNDPLGKDNPTISPPPPPCLTFVNAQETPVPTNSPDAVKCVEVNSAIGTLSPDPLKFITRLLSFFLGISGGVALIIIIVSGYRIMTSQGKPETIQQARETITSTIVGLLFMIFSLVILQVIGVDILHIPGFSR